MDGSIADLRIGSLTLTGHQVALPVNERSNFILHRRGEDPQSFSSESLSWTPSTTHTETVHSQDPMVLTEKLSLLQEKTTIARDMTLQNQIQFVIANMCEFRTLLESINIEFLEPAFRSLLLLGSQQTNMIRAQPMFDTELQTVFDVINNGMGSYGTPSGWWHWWTDPIPNPFGSGTTERWRMCLQYVDRADTREQNYYQNNVALQNQIATLNTQITNLQLQISTLQTTLSSTQQQLHQSNFLLGQAQNALIQYQLALTHAIDAGKVFTYVEEVVLDEIHQNITPESLPTTSTQYVRNAFPMVQGILDSFWQILCFGIKIARWVFNLLPRATVFQVIDYFISFIKWFSPLFSWLTNVSWIQYFLQFADAIKSIADLIKEYQEWKRTSTDEWFDAQESQELESRLKQQKHVTTTEFLNSSPSYKNIGDYTRVKYEFIPNVNSTSSTGMKKKNSYKESSKRDNSFQYFITQRQNRSRSVSLIRNHEKPHLPL